MEMQSSSSFYIPPRPHPTPLQRRRAVRSSGMESGTDEEGPAQYGLSPVRTTAPSFSADLTSSPLESFSSGHPTHRQEGLRRAVTTKGADYSPEEGPRSDATLSGLKIRTVSPPSRPVTTSPTLQKKEKRHHRDEAESRRANELLERAKSPEPRKVSRSKSSAEGLKRTDRARSPEPRQVSRSRSIVQAFEPETRGGSVEPRQVSRSKSIVQMFDADTRPTSPQTRHVSRSKSTVQMFNPEERVKSPEPRPSSRSRSRSRSRVVEPEEEEETEPVQEPRRVSRSKSYAHPDVMERRRSETRQVSRSNSRLNRTNSRLSRSNSRLSRSSSRAKHLHREAEPRRVSRSKTDAPSRKPSVRRSKTAPVPHVAEMPVLPSLSSALLPSHPQLPQPLQSYQPLQHRVSRSNSRARRELHAQPSTHSRLRQVTIPSGHSTDEDLEDGSDQYPHGAYLYASPESMASGKMYIIDPAALDDGRGPRQPAHPMLSREKPEQITILKGSQSAYPLLRRSTLGDVLVPPPVPRDYGVGGRRSRSNTPEPRRPGLRSSASQTLPNGYTFPTSISHSIPRGPMRPLCAVPTRGYTAETVSPLLRFEAEQDDQANSPHLVDRRNIASPASGISMNTSSADHGVVMINGRPFSPDHRPFSPDMITSESSLPATPEASEVGHHLLQVYGDDVQPTLEQLISEQLPITLRPVELDDAGSAYVVDLSKAARKAARRAERLAEKEAKKEAKAVRRATKKDKSRGASVLGNIAPEKEKETAPSIDENEIRRVAQLAAKLEAEVIIREAEKAKEEQALREAKEARRTAREAEKAEARRLAEAETEVEQVDQQEDDQEVGVAAEQRLEAEKEARRAAFQAEKREEERAERVAFERKRAEERAAREAKEAARDEAERQAVADEEDAKARARIARRQTARAAVTPFDTAGPSTEPISPTSHTPNDLTPRKSTRRTPKPEETPKTPAQLEKEAYEASRARAEIEALQKEIDDKVRVSSNLELMANTLARARKARRDSKVLDYGYPSAEFDPPHRTEGMGLKLVTSAVGSGASTRPKKSKSKMVAMVAAVVPGIPKGDQYPRGFRSISYADLQEAAEDRQAEEQERGWEAEVQMKTLQKEQSRSKDFKEWLRRKKSTEIARRLSQGAEDEGTDAGYLGRRRSDDPRLAAMAQGRMYADEEEEWETDEGGSDRSTHHHRHQSPHHRHVIASPAPMSEGEASDQWEDLSTSSRSISDQEVYFRTSGLDEPHHRRSKSRSIKSPMTPDLVRPQPIKRASTVRLLKLEKLAVEEHPLPEPQGVDAEGMRSRVSSRATSVGSAPWLW